MCRLTVYKGRPMLIGDLITNPNNSLIMQSRDAAYHPLVIDRTHRRNILVNGDGFGVAWYGREISKGSCLFKFVTPAWSNSNLRNIGDHVESNLIFAHIRAASSGHDPLEHVAVSHENCHPFKHGPFTFMHNGGIPKFCKIKLKLLNKLHDTFFQEIKGSTDSEHIFALFLTFLYARRSGSTAVRCESESPFRLEEMAAAMSETIDTIVSLCESVVVAEPCSLNCCVTDGVHIVVTRFRNGTSSPPSLYYNFGARFVCEDGVFYPAGDGAPSDIVISSAPLSKVKAYQPSSSSLSASGTSTPRTASLCAAAERETAAKTVSGSEESEHDVCEEDVGSWILMPKNHMLLVRGDPLDSAVVSSVRFEPILVSGSASFFATPSSLSSSSLSLHGKKSNGSGSGNGSEKKSGAQTKHGAKKVARKVKVKAPFTKPLRRLVPVEEQPDEDE